MSSETFLSLLMLAGLEEYMEDLSESSSHCVCVPSYIVHGLLETVAWGEGKGRDSRRLGAHDQEFHQQMLRKLALHLAAQPGTVGTDLPTGPHPQTYAAQSPSYDKRPDKRAQQHQQGKGLFQHDSRPQQEEFHRQMLQKLALHLAAQPDTPTASPHASQSMAPTTSPAMNSATGSNVPERKASSSCSHGQSHHSHPTLQPECHQELLRKLALHLAAQDHPLDKPDKPVQLEIQGAPTAIGEDSSS